MARRAGKMRGDMRAMEEEVERMNPVRGRGATPSMGLSQFRGGGSESDEEMVGGGFLSDLGIPLVSNLAGMIGLGHGDEMRGCGTGAGTKKGQRRRTARRAYEGGDGTGAGTGAGMNEATQMGLHLGKHLHSLHGAGFWDDFKKGFNMVVSPVAGIAKSVLPMLGPEGAAASGVIGALGYGKKGKRGGASNSDTGAYHGKGKLTITHGGGTGGAMLGQDGHGTHRGAGFLSDLGIPVVSNLAGLIGLGEGERAVGAGRRRRAPAGPNDGRRKRAEIVRRVMRDRGVSMIEASSIVKREGLY